MHEETLAQKIGFGMAGIGIIIPSMILSGFMPDWNVLPAYAWVAICAGFGAVGTTIAQPPRIAGFFAGAVGGACIPLALIAYVMLRIQLSDTFWSVEFIIPGLIGALPGVLVFKVLSGLLEKPRDEFARPRDQDELLP